MTINLMFFIGASKLCSIMQHKKNAVNLKQKCHSLTLQQHKRYPYVMPTVFAYASSIAHSMRNSHGGCFKQPGVAGALLIKEGVANDGACGTKYA
ncbi:MAG: hypothetical protein KUA35_01435 [Pseudodesulfovibrio sp.]|uniref:hypothetical protein n=1 Tax=Pseudodesulfovibrio TaxID=2035811 RepID=UPI001DF154F7|nr:MULTISPECIES: hypothetical protein [Pseudodesulfovibrio]MBU4244393.1 hypothetical protein [Pseudomonadota bacterium]MBU4475281.1 hypothetical protein [Pseudomonadota bacterium]MBU4520962.1 hypothetical protein [Pseudomonadota bacterium]MBV1764340.1 hypothetical protein [Pseudodesulfovibrio sp.]MBV1771076.1 hypothetical protein [Pseudodesulfovibrio sp.]